MTVDQKNAWAFLVIAVAGCAVYLGVLLSTAATAGTSPAEVDYAPIMLASIGGAIVAGILAGMVIPMITPAADRGRDQRDREIGRLGEHVGQAFLVLAGVGALLLALLEIEQFFIANVIYLGFVLSAAIGAIARLVAYRRGVPAW